MRTIINNKTDLSLHLILDIIDQWMALGDVGETHWVGKVDKFKFFIHNVEYRMIIKYLKKGMGYTICKK